MHEIIAKMDGGQIGFLILLLSIIAAITIVAVTRHIRIMIRGYPPAAPEKEVEQDESSTPGVA